VASPFLKNANEHAIGAPGCAPAERHPTLPDADSAERAETSDESDEVGALEESAKRSGWAPSSAGRRDRRERMHDGLRARIVLEYSILGSCRERCAPRVAPVIVAGVQGSA